MIKSILMVSSKQVSGGMGDYLRLYFVRLIVSESMSRPHIVWDKTWHLMADDVELRERIKRNNPGI